jgi:hypothetical protein
MWVVASPTFWENWQRDDAAGVTYMANTYNRLILVYTGVFKWFS